MYGFPAVDRLIDLLPRRYKSPSRTHCNFTSPKDRQPIVTGTSVLGIVYNKGIMLAADTLGLFLKVMVQRRMVPWPKSET